ncbi:MAG: histidinol-phosphate transaminase [Desulfitobacteriaceae bacterium]
MVNPLDLTRPEIRKLQAYESKQYAGVVKMDANENPFPWPAGMRQALFTEDIIFNRYPDSIAKELKAAIADYTGVNSDEILVGNGSDEVIQLILTTFGGVGKSVVLHPPTFGMYEAAACVSGTSVIRVPLREGLYLDTEGVLAAASSPEVSIIILCSPNNPTGTLFERVELLRLVRETGKIIIMDEAYAEFSGESIIDEINNYPNLLVMRTFSKAFALAGLRLGYLLGQAATIDLVNRVKQPFNVNVFTQRAGIIALNYLEQYRVQVEAIKAETTKLYEVLSDIPGFKVYSTQANFILFQPDAPDAWAEELFARGFLVRQMGDLPVLGKCLRLSVALPEENLAFIQALRAIASERRKQETSSGICLIGGE